MQCTPGGAPMSLATEWRSMYSLMSSRSMASALPKYCSVSTCNHVADHSQLELGRTLSATLHAFECALNTLQRWRFDV